MSDPRVRPGKDNLNTPDKMRKPGQAELERVVGHFLYHLSNEPDKRGISPRMRFYGTMPIEAKLLFPDVSDDVILNAVKEMIKATGLQTDLTSGDRGGWRSYS